MLSPAAQGAIEETLKYGTALLKFISPNNVGLTGSHECGYYLPKPAWKVFTDMPPTKGRNAEVQVSILWQRLEQTQSVIKWYGAKKSEYRLTRFGKNFPYLSHDNVGNLLVLIPKTRTEFNAWVLDRDEDIEEVQSSLGLELFNDWAIYPPNAKLETENECIEREFRSFVDGVNTFPSGGVLSDETWRVLRKCIRQFDGRPVDDRLVRAVDAEYQLFRLVEQRICTPQMCRTFTTVDDFLTTANSIMNRRKSRAGRSLENHVASILRQEGVPFDARPEIEGAPDLVLPGKREYFDKGYPVEKLVVVGVKTTCKDRWRQVLEEAPRVTVKHLLTIQPGISSKQLLAMKNAGVSLIVPKRYRDLYDCPAGMHIETFQEFIASVKAIMGVA